VKLLAVFIATYQKKVRFFSTPEVQHFHICITSDIVEEKHYDKSQVYRKNEHWDPKMRLWWWCRTLTWMTSNICTASTTSPSVTSWTSSTLYFSCSIKCFLFGIFNFCWVFYASLQLPYISLKNISIKV